MPKNLKIILIISVGVLVILVSVLIFIGQSAVSNLVKLPREFNSTPAPKLGDYPKNENMLMPIGFSNPSVIAAETTYTLSGSIYSIDLGSGGVWKLVFRGSDGNAYNTLPFFITPQTSLTSASNSAKLTAFELKKDQLLNIVYKYNNFTGTGELTSVKILPAPKLK